ncbi:MAG: bifunctional oligoribonuclease/PAP phosphatase NrnA [Deltaproteobacteria bacterium]|nr:bifunctional oligoribonuclease/PAP phosphatase NrnA [Deltaproteobacteria bacterium]
MEKNLSEAGRLLADSHSVIITTHVQPDGDGLGAEIALYHYLLRGEKNVRILNPDPLPERYGFLDRAGAIEIVDPAAKDAGLKPFDLAVIVDTSDPRRINGLWEVYTRLAKNILILDHHPNLAPHLNKTDKARVHALVDERSSSIGELLYRLFHHAHDVLDPKSPTFRYSPEIALGLYVSIITDTNSFRYAGTTALSHRIAADLVDYGLQPEGVYQNVYSTKSAGHLKLIGEVLSGVQESDGGKIAWVEIPLKLRKKYGATSDDTQSIVNFLLLIKNAEVLVLFREEDDGRVKVSIKSKGRVKVNDVANEFGGGGHEFAAGFAHSGSLAELRDKLLKRLAAA